MTKGVMQKLKNAWGYIEKNQDKIKAIKPDHRSCIHKIYSSSPLLSSNSLGTNSISTKPFFLLNQAQTVDRHLGVRL